MTLETITGNLRDGYKQLYPGTMRHVDQLMNERRTHPDEQLRQDLRDQWFYTADGEVYFLDGAKKTPTLAMTREAHNPVLQNIDDAFTQLIGKGNYHVMKPEFEQALAAPETVIVALSDLRLKGNEAEWRYVAIGTTPAKYGKLNHEERKLAERVYGQGNDFVENMKMIKDADIGETKIYVLNPDYVCEHVSEGAVGRASWLNLFDNDSVFNANGRSINYRGYVRGVRRKTDNDQFSAQKSDNSSDFLRRGVIAEGGAQKTGSPYREQGAVLGPTFDEVLAYSASYVPEIVQEQFQAGLRKLYGNR